MVKIDTLKKIAQAVILATPDRKRQRHVAFIVDKSRILSIGYNSSRTHPMANSLFSEIHAELDVALKFGANNRDVVPDFSRYALVVVRLSKRGELVMSKPCSYCQAMIRQLGFRKVWYSNNNGELEEMRLL